MVVHPDVIITRTQYPDSRLAGDSVARGFIIVLSDTPVPWTKPEFILYQPDSPQKLSYREGRTLVLLADGTVRSFRHELTSDEVKTLCTPPAP
jgi:hypothetical protein